MKTRPLPPTDYLRRLFAYNAETGVLTWMKRPLSDFKSVNAQSQWNSRYAGMAAGTRTYKKDRQPACIIVICDYRKYKAHRIAWAIVNGDCPTESLVDHEDCNPFNNRIKNLRLATKSQNAANSRRLRDTAVGIKGVSKGKSGKFEAKIKRNYKSVHLGTFATADEARAAYCSAAKDQFREFARA